MRVSTRAAPAAQVWGKLENVATAVPDLEDRNDGHHNNALRFAKTTWWFLILAFGQWLFVFYLWERYVSAPRAQAFVDLMTVAKISIFIIDAEYHGYYLHGDAPYAHADGIDYRLRNDQQQHKNGRRCVARGRDCRRVDVRSYFDVGHIRGDGHVEIVRLAGFRQGHLQRRR